MSGLFVAMLGPGYAVIHRKSGHVLGEGDGLYFRTRAQAETALEAFETLADWRRSEDRLRRQRHVIEMGDLLCKSIAAEVCR